MTLHFKFFYLCLSPLLTIVCVCLYVCINICIFMHIHTYIWMHMCLNVCSFFYPCRFTLYLYNIEIRFLELLHLFMHVISISCSLYAKYTLSWFDKWSLKTWIQYSICLALSCLVISLRHFAETANRTTELTVIKYSPKKEQLIYIALHSSKYCFKNNESTTFLHYNFTLQ